MKKAASFPLAATSEIRQNPTLPPLGSTIGAQGLTTVFGMETGVAPGPNRRKKRCLSQLRRAATGETESVPPFERRARSAGQLESPRAAGNGIPVYDDKDQADRLISTGQLNNYPGVARSLLTLPAYQPRSLRGA